MSRVNHPSVSVIGTGRLARAVLPLLHRAGYDLRFVAGRRYASARTACKGVPGVRATVVAAKAARSAELILLAVPDREIEKTARSLADCEEPWDGKIFLHHAGSLGTAPLLPLAHRGAAVGVLHPLQALGDGPGAGAQLRGSSARVEGDTGALRVARSLARELGLKALPFPSELTDEQRRIYHAAASLVSNDLLALLATGSDLLRSIGLDETSSLAALASLARGTLTQAGDAGLRAALTGPVTRGDTETLALQLAGLSRVDPAAAELHRLLSRRLLEVVRREGPALSPAERRRWKRLLGGSGGRAGV